MQVLPECGVMEAIFTDEERVRRALESVEGHVSIAALNSPRNTVVSGDRESVARLRQRLEGEGIGSKSLAVSHAFHSALVEPIFPALKDAAAGLTSRTPRVTLISNVTGEPLRTAPAASDRWTRLGSLSASRTECVRCGSSADRVCRNRSRCHFDRVGSRMCAGDQRHLAGFD